MSSVKGQRPKNIKSSRRESSHRQTLYIWAHVCGAAVTAVEDGVDADTATTEQVMASAAKPRSSVIAPWRLSNLRPTYRPLAGSE